MLVRRETPADIPAIRAVTAAAFADPAAPDRIPGEVGLVDELRGGADWLPALSLVALDGDGTPIGHVLCTRGRVGTAPALALAPLAVRPDRQRRGVGLALVHTVLGAADALGEPLVALLGDPAYYRRFGFRPAADHGIAPPVPRWEPHFQVRALSAAPPALQGTFHYPEPFARL
ncbi:GNAT family N-acetyltransferase [Frankia sp. QA3]|uniref:GNAT family N-acetyltransferase n=1 Tax=Frankia sp. QA3 TaxID=710111 RepID=UPI000269BBB0|nr:N-acetyltransferase [Frankia sp. QA3]EIV91725.1 putative acetyltransferase [Frankia sp. QA3]